MFGVYTFGHPYFGQAPDINPADLPVFFPLDLGCTEAVSLMPTRTTDSLMGERTSRSLRHRRTVQCPCCGE
jgi:hypothetical protein